MPAQVRVSCPFDDLALFNLAPDWRRNQTPDREQHLHVPVEADAQCANGHKWKIEGELIVTRVR